MARSFLSLLEQMTREAERNARRRQRETERQQNEQYRETVRAQKARERATKQAARAAEAHRKSQAAEAKAREREATRATRDAEANRKRQAAEAKAAHIAAREAEAEALNAELEKSYSAIDGLLAATLDIDDYFDLETLRRVPDHPPFGHAELERPAAQPAVIQDPPAPVYEEPPPPKALFGKKKKHEAAIVAAREAHALAQTEWCSKLEAFAARRKTLQEEFNRAEQKRLEELKKEKARYSKECAEREEEFADYNAGIDSLIANLDYGAVEAVENYFTIVFSRSIYPEFFPVLHEFNFEPSTAELCLRVLVPPPSELNTTKAYKYVKKNDEIASTMLSQKARKDRYSAAVHQVALRSIHEIFEADRRALIKMVSLEVGCDATDPATGKIGFIPLAAVAAEREAFLEFDLSAVVPKITLEHLGAALSKNPYVLIAADRSGVRRA